MKIKITPFYLQAVAQITYLVLFFINYFKFSFFQYYAYLLCLCLFFYLIIKNVNFFQKKYTFTSLLLLTNSTFLLSLFHPRDKHFLYIALILAIFFKLFFRTKNKNQTLINPVLGSLFVLAMIFPEKISVVAPYWSSESWQLLILIILGTWVNYLAKTLYIALSYILSFLIFPIFFYYISINFDFYWTKAVNVSTPVTWFISIFSFNFLLFAFHAITDPQSGPKKIKEQLVFGFLLGFLDIFFRHLQFLNSNFLAYAITISFYMVYSNFNFSDLPDSR